MTRAQHGFATPIVLAMLVIIATSLAAIDAAAALVAASRARSAADAAAIAAATGEWPFLGQGSDPAASARTAAQLNGARVESCECPLRGASARVTVSVPTSVRILHVVPPRLFATATASVHPGVLFEGG